MAVIFLGWLATSPCPVMPMPVFLLPFHLSPPPLYLSLLNNPISIIICANKILMQNNILLIILLYLFYIFLSSIKLIFLILHHRTHLYSARSSKKVVQVLKSGSNMVHPLMKRIGRMKHLLRILFLFLVCLAQVSYH